MNISCIQCHVKIRTHFPEVILHAKRQHSFWRYPTDRRNKVKGDLADDSNQVYLHMYVYPKATKFMGEIYLCELF